MRTKSVNPRIPLQILFAILLFLSISTSVSAITLPFFSRSTLRPQAIPNLEGQGVKARGYISSSKRLNSPRRFGYFSFSRHPRSLPDWNPLEGIEGVLVHQGIHTPHSRERDLSPESSTSTQGDGKIGKIIQEIHSTPISIPAENNHGTGNEEEDEGELVERDGGDFILEDFEDCEKRQEYNDPLPIAQLGSIPEKEIELSRAQTQILDQELNANPATPTDGNSDTDTSPSSDGSMNDRKHNDKILWSGLESLLPLEKGLFRRHSDKSNRPKHGDEDDYGGGGDREGGRRKGGKHGKYNDNDDSYQSDGRGSGRYGKHQSDYNEYHGGNGEGGKGSNGDHHGEWNGHGWKSHQGLESESGYRNGKGRPSWHENGSGGGNGNGVGDHGKFQQDWESPSSDGGEGGYHHGDSYGTKSKAMNNGGDDNDGWHHTSSNYNDGSKGGYGDGNKWDDGFGHHPWNPHSDSGSDWSHHPSSSSTGQWNHPSSWNNNNNDDDNGDHPSQKPTSNINSNTDSQGFSSQSQTQSNSNSHHSDCINLAKFYQSFQQQSKDGWVNRNGWSENYDDFSRDCCQWFGITCDPISKRVTAVNLRNNGLKGDLDEALFSLDALMRIDLSQNALTSLPDKFENLIKVTHLNISNSNLPSSVKIPYSLLNSNSIINLDLSNNELSDYHVQISSSSLKSLDLSNNKITGFSINTDKVTNLSKVILRNNGLVGGLPDLSGLRSLQTLDLSFNKTGPLFDISNLTNLTRLDVRSNQLTGSFPSLPPSIQSLYLSNNQLTGPIPSYTPPSGLTTCYVLPNPFSPCPTKEELSNPESLASKCHLRSCGSNSAASATSSTSTEGGGTTIDASQITSTTPTSMDGKQKGIPVNPLPGENLNIPPSSPVGSNQIQNQQQAGGSTIISGDGRPVVGVKGQNQNQLPQSQRLGSTKSMSGSSTSKITNTTFYPFVLGLFSWSVGFGLL